MSSPVADKLRHSKISKILVLISGVVLFGFLLIAFFIGKQVRFKEQIIIKGSLKKLYIKVSDLQEWKYWTVWDDVYYENQFDRKFEYVTNERGQVIKSLEYEVEPLQNSINKSFKSHPVLIIERVKVVTNQAVSSGSRAELEISFLYSLWNNQNKTSDNQQANLPPVLTAWSRIFIRPSPTTETTANNVGANQIDDVAEYQISWEYDGDYSPVMGSNPLQRYFLVFTELSLKRAYRQSLESLKEKLEKN